MSEMKYTYWCCKAEFGEHEETCPNYKSECAPDSMQRVVPNAATSDVPVTREPPHLADRSAALMKLRGEYIRKIVGSKRYRKKQTLKGKPTIQQTVRINAMTEFVEKIDELLHAEAREERPSGRPNAGRQLSEAEEGTGEL